VFCQECGQRLAPRVAAPTPPSGLPPLTPLPPAPQALPPQPAANPLGATVPGESSPPSGRSAAARPEAPAFDFGPPKPHSSAPAAVRTACPRCAAWNEPGIRFCVSCGNGLGPMTVPIPAPQQPAAGAIAPARVVPVTPISAPAAAEVRVCSRCRGACDANSQFCRFCGAPLGAPDAAARAPQGSAPAPQEAAPAAQSSTPTTDPIPAGPPSGRVPLPDVPPPAPLPSPGLDRPARAAPAPTPVSDGRADTGQLHGSFSPPPADEILPRARVVIIAKDGGEGASYSVGETLDLGRSEGDVVIAEDRYLSPRHARIVRRGKRLYLRDLGSTNGLYLRLRPSGASGPSPSGARGSDDAGAPSGPNPKPPLLSLAHPLRDQDLLLVGQQVLRFEVVNDADEGLGPASQHGTLLFGSPATPRYARLCQRTVEGVIRDVFYIRKAETVLGRESGDVVFTEDPFLSRRHATLRVEKDPRRFLLTDLGSSNGTFVQVRGEIPLESGDQFRIGQQLFRVDIA
jgi:pSer/pThr/pTyr-binding forkhead associated (FHA) protein